MRRNKPVCVHCGSDNVDTYQHCEFVLECLDCGELFDDDEFEVELVREKYDRIKGSDEW